MRPDDKIGPYVLKKKIGSGNYGVVWLAEKRTYLTTTQVALKLPKDEDIDLEVVRMEAGMWVQASGHPNVLPIIEADMHDGQVVIVSEYAPDGSLELWLQKHDKKAPSIDLAVEIAAGILSGLKHLHNKQIIHRDLKPANILLQGETPRLADFGIARALKSTSQSSNIAGTPSYMAPEAFKARRSVKTDLWSAGVIFYQLLTGALPFPQQDMESLMYAIINEEPVTLPDWVPNQLAEVISRTLQKDPEKRYDSAAEMRDDLREASRSLSRRIPTGPVEQQPVGGGFGAQTERASGRETVGGEPNTAFNPVVDTDAPTLRPGIGRPTFPIEQQQGAATAAATNSIEAAALTPEAAPNKPRRIDIDLPQLSESPRPIERKPKPLPLVLGGIAAVLVIGLAVYFIFISGNHDASSTQVTNPNALADTGATAKAPSETIVVAKQGGGQYTSIGDAIRVAQPDARIMVQPGLYTEGLILNKPLEIVGSGPADQIIVESTDTDCIIMQTDKATVRGLTLRNRAGDKKKFYGVDIPRGELVLEDCDITSNSLAGVAIHGSTSKPILRRCRVRETTTYGVAVFDSGQGTIENCEVYGHGVGGIIISKGGNPLIQGSKIRDSKGSGVDVINNGRGTLIDNEIFGNGYAGLNIESNASPVVKQCRIHDGKSYGVFITGQGQGSFEQCEIFGNAKAGIAISKGGNPTIISCKIRDGQASGILITGDGQGSITDCDIFNNTLSGVQIDSGSNPLIQGCKIRAGRSAGVLVTGNGQGRLENCEIFDNTSAGLHIENGGSPVVRKCKIIRNQSVGVYVSKNGRGVIEECDVRENTIRAWNIEAGAVVQRSNNTE